MKKNSRLSKILRHIPSDDFVKGGWFPVDVLISKYGYTIEEITTIVETNNKGRFEISKDNRWIRALYGHSIDVDLDLKPVTPPEVLFHGTAVEFLNSIKQQGLNRGRRRFVHLSDNSEIAAMTGERHGTPVILVVASGEMSKDGFVFYHPHEKVWLTESVPVRYIETQPLRNIPRPSKI